jgi:hypothetical protein
MHTLCMCLKFKPDVSLHVLSKIFVLLKDTEHCGNIYFIWHRGLEGIGNDMYLRKFLYTISVMFL